MATMRIRAWLIAGLLALITLMPFGPRGAWASTENDASKDYANAIGLLLEGRVEAARVALESLANQSPEHAGAWLDLAILHCGLGHQKEAMVLFDTIESRFSPPPGIRQLIDHYRRQGCSAAGQARLRIGRGHDSNVNQGAGQTSFSLGSGSGLVNLILSPEFFPKSDAFTSVGLDAVRPLSEWGALLLGQYQIRRYDNLHRYDLQSLTLGIDKPFLRNDWEFAVTGALSLHALDSRLYHSRTQLIARAAPPLPMPRQWKAGLAVGTAHMDYPTLPGYAAQQSELYAWIHYNTLPLTLRVNLGHAIDQSKGSRAGGDRDGFFMHVNGRAQIEKALVAEFSWIRQRFSDERIYSPGLIDLSRRQDTDMWRAALLHPVGKNDHLFLEYRDIKNRENISLFTYQSRQLQIGWQTDFSF